MVDAAAPSAAAKSFDAYEVIGVITPGAVLALLLAIEWPSLKALIGNNGLSVGDLGLFVIVAFVLGHLLQSAGNLVEWLLWTVPGMPTTWVRSSNQNMLSPAQRDALQVKVSAMEGAPSDLAKVDRRRWAAITRRAYGRVAAAGLSARIDAHNRTYGLCRGLAAAFLIALIWAVVVHRQDCRLIVGLALALSSALWRMWKMGLNYARTLLLAFIDLEVP